MDEEWKFAGIRKCSIYSARFIIVKLLYFVLAKEPEGLWHKGLLCPSIFLGNRCSCWSHVAAWRSRCPPQSRDCVRLSRQCRKEDEVLLCGCLHRVTSATTTKSNNYFNCKVWKQSRSFRLQLVFQVFTLLLVCNYSGLWSPKSKDVRGFIVVFPLATWYWLHYHGGGKWQSTADAQHPWLIWCSTG